MLAGPPFLDNYRTLKIGIPATFAHNANRIWPIVVVIFTIVIFTGVVVLIVVVTTIVVAVAVAMMVAAMTTAMLIAGGCSDNGAEGKAEYSGSDSVVSAPM